MTTTGLDLESARKVLVTAGTNPFLYVIYNPERKPVDWDTGPIQEQVVAKRARAFFSKPPEIHRFWITFQLRVRAEETGSGSF